MRSFSMRTLLLVLFFAAIISLIARDQIDARPLEYEEYSQARLQAHLDSGHCVLVTLYASWTLSSSNQLNGMSHQVTRQIRKHGVVAMSADWTSKETPVGDLMNDLKLTSVPAIAIYDFQTRTDPLIFADLVTEQQLVAAVCQCGKNADRTKR